MFYNDNQWLCPGIHWTGGYAVSNPTYFVQECPTCGRRLQIRVEYLGRRVVCQHCQGTLIATDPASIHLDSTNEGSSLLRRADQLLASIAKRQKQMNLQGAETSHDVR
jgi:DNA-directed RNA polymerase subunit RPC12/RpoP